MVVNSVETSLLFVDFGSVYVKKVCWIWKKFAGLSVTCRRVCVLICLFALGLVIISVKLVKLGARASRRSWNSTNFKMHKNICKTNYRCCQWQTLWQTVITKGGQSKQIGYKITAEVSREGYTQPIAKRRRIKTASAR